MKPAFIQCQHPKATIKPDRDAIAKVISYGWWGQKKVNGARAQIHISSEGDFYAFTRKGTPHTVVMPLTVSEILLELFRPRWGWTVLDAEWLRYQDQIFLFDLLRQGSKYLSNLTYEQRFQRLNDVSIINPHVSILPVYKSVNKCLKVLDSDENNVEGLVFKSPTTVGWPNTAIVRCRKNG